MSINEILKYNVFKYKDFQLSIDELLLFVIVLLAARLMVFFLDKVLLKRYFKQRNIDKGRQFATSRLIKYFIYIVGLLTALQIVGLNITLLLAGSAALLVGVGLGLQQTFNDLVSGLILLFEGSVEVGDIVEVDGKVGIVRKIGIRTSQIETKEKIDVVVPNSKITVNSVINWSHSTHLTRFSLPVSVAYGSDPEKVRSILLSVAKDCQDVKRYPPTIVRFLEFGDSALHFDIFFASDDILGIENIKSNMRFMIEKRFREHGITIPFPQLDLHVKSLKNASLSSD
ncbi:MAG: mechanosensitive ion channel [Chitinophagales bacterium]|nr:mechanosensitive ion channel [Chitinophagales bacterium]